jgi:DNA-binding LacI/PurR family transcriptional regulator
MSTGIKKVRLADIAAKAGVSAVTVGKALNSTGGKNARIGAATAARIREIAARLNYHPNSIAQQLAGKKSGIIGVVMDSCAPQTYYERLSKIEVYASAKNYKLMIGQAHEDIEKIKDYAYKFSSYGVDGIICMAVFTEETSQVAELYNNTAKTVFLGKPSGLNNSCSVSIDTRGAYSRAVEYLSEKGRKKIALILMDGVSAEMSQAIRKSGYVEGLKNCGMPFAEELVCRIPIADQMNERSYLETIKKLVFEQKVDAILTCNDEVAAIVIKILLELNVKVPDDISVIGYDNTNVAKLFLPSITTFDQNNDEASKAIVDLLIKLIKEEDVPPEERSIVVEPLLIKRKSA